MTKRQRGQGMAKQSDNGIKKYALPELLAPCGSPEALDAALLGGADAVYLGTKILNARMNARNFEGDALRDGIAKAHRAGVKVYITMNTAVTDRQMHQAMTSAQDLCKMGADALIVADLGFASMLRKYLPGLPIHASTQCSAHSLDGVRFLAERGFSRVVIARELSKANIEYIVKNSPVPIEIFVHGAMCVSASGQCLLSSFIGGRSGNRGECAQPCRMQYNGGYPLSLKDMCLAGHITEITASGAASLKIEGRMKSPEYVYNVTSVYRRLLDQRRNAGEKEMKLLEASFSRGGFSDGYYTGKLSGMNGVRSENDKAAARELRTVMKPSGRKLPQITVGERESIPFTAEEINKKGKAPDFTPVRSARWYRPETMCGGETYGTPRVIAAINENRPATMKKLFQTLNEIYEDGTNDTQSLIAVSILGKLDNDQILLARCVDYMSETMAPPVIEVNRFLATPAGKKAQKKMQNPPPYKPKKKKKQGFLSQMMAGGGGMAPPAI